VNTFSKFDDAVTYALFRLEVDGQEVDSGRWQGIPTEGKPDLRTKEILDLHFAVNLERASWYGEEDSDYTDTIARELKPNLPWADEHFAERVGGVPMNPDPSYKRWPWWKGQDAETKRDNKFTHTYSERFWPRYAGEGDEGPYRTFEGRDNFGIRYEYGDYNDLLDLLAREPYTRQAYLPIFFPEDTGAVHRGRIPCSLGYHFLLRGGRLSCWYEIRSCDAVRHFRDDLYLAVRLVAHTIETLAQRALREDFEHRTWIDVDPGLLYFTAHSFHVHQGDLHRL
jgi:thymidylate synthase